MTLRRRLALLSALAVALAVLLASALVYTLVRDRLRGDIDHELRQQAERITQRFATGPTPGGPGIGEPQVVGGGSGAPPPPGVAAPDTDGKGKKAQGIERGEQYALTLPPPEPGGPEALAQLISANGTVIPGPSSAIQIPVSSADRSLAAGGGGARFEDTQAGGADLRVLTQPQADGTAIQVARSLEDTNHTLDTLIIILAAVSAGGIALAAALGPVVARAALAPAGEVSDAAEQVARTHDLTHRIEVRGEDELGRLAASFNEMMVALERAEAAQRRLVADASHELRTPLASLRTNIETLGRGAHSPVRRYSVID